MNMGSEQCPGNGGTGPRCPDGICDCFIDTHPENPSALRPEDFIVTFPPKKLGEAVIDNESPF